MKTLYYPSPGLCSYDYSHAHYWVHPPFMLSKQKTKTHTPPENKRSTSTAPWENKKQCNTTNLFRNLILNQDTFKNKVSTTSSSSLPPPPPMPSDVDHIIFCQWSRCCLSYCLATHYSCVVCEMIVTASSSLFRVHHVVFYREHSSQTEWPSTKRRVAK